MHPSFTAVTWRHQAQTYNGNGWRTFALQAHIPNGAVTCHLMISPYTGQRKLHLIGGTSRDVKVQGKWPHWNLVRQGHPKAKATAGQLVSWCRRLWSNSLAGILRRSFERIMRDWMQTSMSVRRKQVMGAPHFSGFEYSNFTQWVWKWEKRKANCETRLGNAPQTSKQMTLFHGEDTRDLF